MHQTRAWPENSPSRGSPPEQHTLSLTVAGTLCVSRDLASALIRTGVMSKPPVCSRDVVQSERGSRQPRRVPPQPMTARSE